MEIELTSEISNCCENHVPPANLVASDGRDHPVSNMFGRLNNVSKREMFGLLYPYAISPTLDMRNWRQQHNGRFKVAQDGSKDKRLSHSQRYSTTGKFLKSKQSDQYRMDACNTRNALTKHGCCKYQEHGERFCLVFEPMTSSCVNQKRGGEVREGAGHANARCKIVVVHWHFRRSHPQVEVIGGSAPSAELM